MKVWRLSSERGKRERGKRVQDTRVTEEDQHWIFIGRRTRGPGRQATLTDPKGRFLDSERTEPTLVSAPQSRTQHVRNGTVARSLPRIHATWSQVKAMNSLSGSRDECIRQGILTAKQGVMTPPPLPAKRVTELLTSAPAWNSEPALYSKTLVPKKWSSTMVPSQKRRSPCTYYVEVYRCGV